MYVIKQAQMKLPPENKMKTLSPFTEQFMKDLPKSRLTPGKPFENTAVDYFGPFHEI